MRYVPIFEQRQKELENKAFQKFLLNSVDEKDVYELNRLQELFPEIWEAREQMLIKEADKYKMLAELNLKGKATTAEDFIILYNIANGLIEFSPEVLKSIMGLDNINEKISTTSKRFKRGILNYTKYKKYEDTKQVYKIDLLQPFKADGTVNYKTAQNGARLNPDYTNSAIGQAVDTNRTIRGLYTAR